MTQFMIVAVTCPSQNGSHYQEIGLFDGKFGYKDSQYHIWNATCYATAAENAFNSDLVGMVVSEVGVKVKDFVLDLPFVFIWGDSKQEIIDKFLTHNFEKLI